MRIAIFSDNFYPELSGITDSIMTTGRELARRGHRMAYYAPHYSSRNYRRVKRPRVLDMGPNIEVHRLPSLPFRTGTGQGRAAIPTGIAIMSLRKFDPDVIHFNHIFGTGLEAIFAAKVLGKPLVGTCHTPMVEFLKYNPVPVPFVNRLILRYDGWVNNHANFLSSPTRYIFDAIDHFDQRIPHHAISNPIDVEKFFPPRIKKSAKTPFTILYAGRLATEKNIEVVIRAVALAKRIIPRIQLKMVGRGDHEQELRTLIKSLGLERDADFLGFVAEDDLPAVYHASDLFAIMSTAETQSIVAMQALACGIPVLAARAWGFKEYITPKVGYLIEPGDHNALAEKIIFLYKHPALRREIGTRGRKHVAQFSIPHVADTWERVYHETVSKYHVKS